MPTSHPSLAPILGNRALRFSVRAAISALITFAITRAVDAPLHGLWAVLTAVVVMQTSAGGSIRATAEYVVGTLVGAVYASAVSILIPHSTPVATGAVLVLAVAPLAYAAALSPIFRVAPFTAVVVLLLAGQFREGPITAATIRLGEVAFGGVVAIAVSFLVFPERGHEHSRQQAAAALRRLAAALPKLLAGLANPVDPDDVRIIQDELGASINVFAQAIADAAHEKRFRIGALDDPGPLSRTLLRLRHDLVIFGRAAAVPFPASVAQRLMPLVSEAGDCVAGWLAASADALAKSRVAPSLESARSSLDAFARAVAAMRSEGATRALSGSDLEQLFALSFGFEQLRDNLADLDRCVRDWARS